MVPSGVCGTGVIVVSSLVFGDGKASPGKGQQVGRRWVVLLGQVKPGGSGVSGLAAGQAVGLAFNPARGVGKALGGSAFLKSVSVASSPLVRVLAQPADSRATVGPWPLAQSCGFQGPCSESLSLRGTLVVGAKNPNGLTGLNPELRQHTQPVGL